MGQGQANASESATLLTHCMCAKLATGFSRSPLDPSQVGQRVEVLIAAEDG
jgi:hypothetical protein